MNNFCNFLELTSIQFNSMIWKNIVNSIQLNSLILKNFFNSTQFDSQILKISGNSIQLDSWVELNWVELTIFWIELPSFVFHQLLQWMQTLDKDHLHHVKNSRRKITIIREWPKNRTIIKYMVSYHIIQNVEWVGAETISVKIINPIIRLQCMIFYISLSFTSLKKISFQCEMILKRKRWEKTSLIA